MVKNCRNLLAVLTAFLMVLGLTASALAHSIDYVAYDIRPVAEFLGNSGNFRVINPVMPGTEIKFWLNLELIESPGGKTSELPITVTFSVQNMGGPFTPFDVKFGTAGGATSTYTYEKNKTLQFTTEVTAIAPLIPGSYHFKIQADNNASQGLNRGEGIVVHFTVADCQVAETNLEITQPACLIYKAPSASFTATLTSGGAPLAGKAINFSVNDSSIGSELTDSSGKATIAYNPSGLGVGDHTVYASFAGETCDYKASSMSATFGVTYKFLGFQPPVQIEGVGAGLFTGKVVPVMIKIADYYGNSVPDKTVYVFFGQAAEDVSTADAVAEAIQADSGNTMRYDPIAEQYIFNWNVGGLPDGSYVIRVSMNEGERCTTPRWAPVKIKKSGGKK